MKIFWRIILAIISIVVLLFIINEIQIVTNCKSMIRKGSITAKLNQCIKDYTLGIDYSRISPAD